MQPLDLSTKIDKYKILVLFVKQDIPIVMSHRHGNTDDSAKSHTSSPNGASCGLFCSLEYF